MVQCFPLYSVLLALDNPKVDYFSLDIEGAEIPVLTTIPFDKVDISLISVESNHLGDVFDGNVEDLTRLMEDGGYEYRENAKIDMFFAKKGLKKKKKKEKKTKKKT